MYTNARLEVCFIMQGPVPDIYLVICVQAVRSGETECACKILIMRVTTGAVTLFSGINSGYLI